MIITYTGTKRFVEGLYCKRIFLPGDSIEIKDEAGNELIASGLFAAVRHCKGKTKPPKEKAQPLFDEKKSDKGSVDNG